MIRGALIPAFLILASCTRGASLGDKTVLDVNGRRMRATEFAQELAYRLKDLDALSAKDPKLVKATKAKIAEDFVMQTLTEDWAKQNGVVIRAEDLENQIQTVRKSFPDDLAFRQALAEDGQTLKEWRERMQNTLLQRLVIKRLNASLTAPGETEAQTYYNQRRQDFAMRETAQVRQILVATEADAKTMDDLLKRGKSMAELAKKYSISPEGAQGGMVGWLEKGYGDVLDNAFRFKQGMRSPVIKSAFGYHILEVVGRKPAHVKAYPDVRDQIKRILMEKREQSVYFAWAEEQVRRARVFKDQDLIDGLNVETRIGIRNDTKTGTKIQ